MEEALARRMAMADMGCLRRADHRLLRDDVADALRDAILDGKMAPGTRLIESAIAEQMGVSRGPVREALVELERQGLVVMEPHRGAVVRPMQPRDAWEVYTLRAELEALAIRQGREYWGDEEISALRQVLTRMEALRDEDGQAAAAKLDLEFHGLVCGVSRNRRLIGMFRGLDPLVWGLFLAVTSYLGLGPTVMAERHRPIVEALAARDFDLAMRVVREHYVRTAEEMLRRQVTQSRTGGGEGYEP